LFPVTFEVKSEAVEARKERAIFAAEERLLDKCKALTQALEIRMDRLGSVS
jgi:hypothetical protein